jgi:hypothetical protein
MDGLESSEVDGVPVSTPQASRLSVEADFKKGEAPLRGALKYS